MTILICLSIAGSGLLIWSGAEHVVPGTHAPDHQVAWLHAAPSRRVAYGTALAVVGVLGILAWWYGGSTLRLLLLTQGALYAVFAVYLARRIRAGDTGDCRCTRLTARVGPAVLVRAGVLSLASICAYLFTGPADLLNVLSASQLLQVAAGSFALAVVAYVWPSAVDGLPRMAVQ